MWYIGHCHGVTATEIKKKMIHSTGKSLGKAQEKRFWRLDYFPDSGKNLTRGMRALDTRSIWGRGKGNYRQGKGGGGEGR